MTSPVTWRIVLAYVAGKPLGILAAVWAASQGAHRRAEAPMGVGILLTAIVAPAR